MIQDIQKISPKLIALSLLFVAKMLNTFPICVFQRTISLALVPTSFILLVTAVRFLHFHCLFMLLLLLLTHRLMDLGM